MRVRVVAFASAAEALGCQELEVELGAEAGLAELEAALLARHPGLAEVWPRLALAVDGRVAEADAQLSDGVEVALLPPVSGGGESSCC